MKKLSILAPVVVTGVLLAAVVLAAPLSSTADGSTAGFPNRAEAYQLATLN